MTDLIPQAVYVVKLCSGEERHWQYMGQDVLARSLWRDMETGLSFNETSLLYVWEIVGKAP
jgi:hypothetical protein